MSFEPTKLPAVFSSVQDLKDAYDKLRTSFSRFQNHSTSDISEFPTEFSSEQELKDGYERLRSAFMHSMHTAGVRVFVCLSVFCFR